MPTLDVPGLDLDATLHSGQLFRFWPHEGGYLVGQRDRVFFVRQRGRQIAYEGCTLAFLTRFLRLDDSLDEILKPYSTDSKISPILQSCQGLRLMRQDPWECLIGFLCSSASNIPKIQRNLHGLCKAFGVPLTVQGGNSNAFPRPGSMTDKASIHAVGTGFRSAYIHAANTRVTDAWLASLKRLSYQEAREALMAIPGVGGKIADCVMLFSLDFTQAFPVDVWVRRALHALYPYTRRLSQARLERYGRRRFGTHAGYIQQYLYHWRRTREPARPRNI